VLIACFRNLRTFDHIAASYHVHDGRGLVLDASEALIADGFETAFAWPQ